MKHKSLTQWNRKPAKYNVIYCFSTQFCQIHNSNGHPTGIKRALLFFSPFFTFPSLLMMHRTDICVRNKCCSISCRDMRSKEEWRKKREQSQFSARNHLNLSVNRYHTFYITLCVHHSMWLRKSSCSWTVYYIVVVIFHAVVMFIFCCVLLSSIFFRSFVLLLRLRLFQNIGRVINKLTLIFSFASCARHIRYF